LAAVPTELSHSLFAKARPVSLTASQTLFVTGDEGDGCYRVEEGLLKASIVLPAGGERVLAILGPGSVVGELSMIDRGPLGLRHEVELLRSPSWQLAVSVCVAKPSPVQAYRVGVLARGLPAKAFVAKLAR
jgi:CRP-like cAMP-binding protein